MFLRKWLVRGLVALVLAGCLGAGVVYQQWTNPGAVRKQVVEMLEKQLPGATVTLGSAHLRLLGGVVLNELHLLHRGTSQSEIENNDDQSDIVHIPQAIVYHDKQQLSRGQFAVSRIKMVKPVIRIIRNKDGKWNVDGLTPDKTDPSAPLPTIIVENGRLEVEDRFAGPAAWELHELDLTLINEGAGNLRFNGTAQSDTLGAIAISGIWNRVSNDTTLSFHTAGLLIAKELVRYAASHDPGNRLTELKLQGKADIEGKVAYHSSATPPLTHEVHCLLRQSSIEHPKLPVPLHNLSAMIHWTTDKLVLQQLKAAAGSGKIECQGWVDPADPENTFAGQLSAYHLPITEELVSRLKKVVQEKYAQFQPSGCANVQISAERQKGVWLREFCRFEPDNIDICFDKFRYPLERVTGYLDFDFLPSEYRSKFEFTGYAGTQPIIVRGATKGQRPDVEGIIEISGQDLVLDDKLLSALPGDKAKGIQGGKIQGVAASFHAAGMADFHGVLRLVPGNPELQCTYQIHFHDSSVKWDEFPFPLENVSGDLVVYPLSRARHEQYEFTNFKGTHNGGEVFVSGGTLPQADGKDDGKLIVNVIGRNVCLDTDLKEALKNCPRCYDTWATFSPTGRIGFQAKVERLPRQAKDQLDMDVSVSVAGCQITPSFFPYSLHDVTGRFLYRKDKVELTHFTARHNNSQLSIANGSVDISKDGGFYVQLDGLCANPLLADDELFAAFASVPGLRSVADALHLKDQTLAINTKLVVSRSGDRAKAPEVFWDGVMGVSDAQLSAGIELSHVTGTVACRGLHDGKLLAGLYGNLYLNDATILKQPFHGVRGHFVMSDNAPDTMLFSLNAPIFGGDISGQGRLELNGSQGNLRSYEVDLTASQIQLEELGRENLGPRQQLAGIAAGRLYLHGKGNGLKDMEGNGSIDIPYSPITRLLNLPLLLDLLKFLGLRVPDRTAFEEAHAAFAIDGNRVTISKLELQGNAVSLYGQGGVNLDGDDLQLDMYSTPARVEQLLPTAIRSIPAAISKQLLKIEVRGKVSGKEGDLNFSQQLVPGITGPLADWRDRMLRRMSSDW